MRINRTNDYVELGEVKPGQLFQTQYHGFCVRVAIGVEGYYTFHTINVVDGKERRLSTRDLVTLFPNAEVIPEP